MLDLWGEQIPHDWVTGDDELGATRGFVRHCASGANGYVLGALHHHHTRPGGPTACVPGTRKATEAAVAAGDGLASRTRPRGRGPT